MGKPVSLREQSFKYMAKNTVSTYYGAVLLYKLAQSFLSKLTFRNILNKYSKYFVKNSRIL